MTRLRFLRLLLSSVLLILLAPAVFAASGGPLAIVLLPGTSLTEWRDSPAPHLHQLMASGALAVMNTRTARAESDRARETPESAALTLSAGARAAGDRDSLIFSPAGAPTPAGITAGELYERRMLDTAPPGSLVDVEWPEALRENTGRGYDITLGALADCLARVGVPIQAGGGALADSVVVNSRGIVFPIPADAVLQGRMCRVWDGGSDPAAADALLARIAAQVFAAHGRLIVLSPFAGDSDYRAGRRLCPVLVWGEGIQAGLLVSPSTRRAGLVTNTDFAPSAASFFGQKLPLSTGRSWSATPTDHALEDALPLESGAYQQAQGMRILPYIAVFLGLWMALGAMLYSRNCAGNWLPIIPIAILLGLVLGTSAASFVAWTSVFLAIGLAAGRQIDSGRIVTIGAAALAGLLVADLCLGDPLMRRGLLGYSAVEGARYYGMGNEAMGVLVGATLVAVTSTWRLVKRPGRIALLLLMLLACVLLGAPQAGAKAGGLIVSVAAFGMLTYGLAGGRWSARATLAACLAGFLAIGLAALLDSKISAGQQSHIGLAMRHIRLGGIGEAGDIILRKIGIEGHLFVRSAWACPLWLGAISLMVIARRQRERMQMESALLMSGSVAVALCLMVNDAGAVAASFCLSLLWGAVLAGNSDGPRHKTAKSSPGLGPYTRIEAQRRFTAPVRSSRERRSFRSQAHRPRR